MALFINTDILFEREGGRERGGRMREEKRVRGRENEGGGKWGRRKGKVKGVSKLTSIQTKTSAN